MTTLTALRSAAWGALPAAAGPVAVARDAVASGRMAEPVAQPATTGTLGSVAFDGVAKVYRAAAGDVEALVDISLAVPAGSNFGIIGRSGAASPRCCAPSTGWSNRPRAGCWWMA